MNKAATLLIISILFLAPASAQENNNSSDSLQEVTKDIDNSTRVVAYDFDHPEQDYIIVESDYPRTLSIMDVNALIDDNTEQLRADPTTVGTGETKINVDPDVRAGDKTIAVWAGNSGTIVTNEATGSLIGNPNAYQFALGSISGGFAVFFMLYVGIRITNYKYNKEPRRVF